MGTAPIELRDPKTTNALLEELSQAVTSHSEASLHAAAVSVGIALALEWRCARIRRLRGRANFHGNSDA